MKLILALLFFSLSSFGRGVISGYCERGGQTVNTGGLSSSTYVQRSYPSCTITVTLYGTSTHATLYSDNSGSLKSNPFLSDSTGYWYFFADDGNFTIQVSGSGILVPFTRSDSIGSGSSSFPYPVTTTPGATSVPLSNGAGKISAGWLPDALADGVTKGVSAYTASDFNSSSGLISLDYTNGQKATGSVPGFLLAADWTTFNSKQAALGYTPENLANKNAPSGYAPLDGSALLPLANIPTNLTGKNAATATAFASNPTDCSVSNTFANIIAANGNLTCDYERMPSRAVVGTTDTILSTDLSKFITYSNGSAIAVTLPQATGSFADGFWFITKNIGVGDVTVTPTTSVISGVASIVISTGEYCIIRSDGTNYEAACNRLSQGTNVTLTKARTGVTIAVSAGAGTVTVVGSGNLGSTQLVTGGGTQLVQTPSSAATLDGSGNLAVTSVATGTSPPTVVPGTGGVIAACKEGTVPSVGAAATVDIIYCDSTQHGPMMSRNNGTYLPVPQGPASTSSGDAACWNSTNGGLLSDCGAPPSIVPTVAGLTATRATLDLDDEFFLMSFGAATSSVGNLGWAVTQIAGSGGAVSTPAVGGHEGLIRVYTGASTSDREALSLDMVNTSASATLSDMSATCACTGWGVLLTFGLDDFGPSIVSNTIEIGFSTAVAVRGNNTIAIRYSDQSISCSNGSNSTTDLILETIDNAGNNTCTTTGVAAVANTFYTCFLYSTTLGTIGAQCASGTNALSSAVTQSTNVPTTTMKPVIINETHTTAQKRLNMDRWHMVMTGLSR